MACKICGRDSCTECFHSIEEQEQCEQDEWDILESEAQMESEHGDWGDRQ